MGARTKLNAAYLNGALGIAAILGGAAQSWSLFFTVLLSITIAQTVLGHIRPRAR